MTADPPGHLSEAARLVWAEVMARPDSSGLLPANVEAYCVQVARMRDAAARVDAEGLVVSTDKGPVPHPAIELERLAQVQVRLWAEHLGLLSAVVDERKVDPLDEIAERRAARWSPSAKGAGRAKRQG